jgi:hypothetical protein
MNYYQKYLKYKQKYESLIQQSGGEYLKPGEYLISDPEQLDKLENVSTLPMGYHTFYEGKEQFPTLKHTDGVRISTYPNFDGVKTSRSSGHSYTKIKDAEMTGAPITTRKYKSDKQCAETCSKSIFCNSFNVSKSGKQKVCEFHSNSSRFIPDNIHENKGANYFEKIYHY